jgi:hypothetical protein
LSRSSRTQLVFKKWRAIKCPADSITAAKLAGGNAKLFRKQHQIYELFYGMAVAFGNEGIVDQVDNFRRRNMKGSRITFGVKPAIIAAEVKKGDEVLKLRDDSGFPVWSGWRRR